MQQLACTPTLILHNARIYTQDAAQPWAQAVAVGDGRILAVGADADVLALAGAGTERIDLGGKLMLPGSVRCAHSPVALCAGAA
jgi:predicted amidohydrolase YtcJ